MASMGRIDHPIPAIPLRTTQAVPASVTSLALEETQDAPADTHGEPLDIFFLDPSAPPSQGR